MATRAGGAATGGRGVSWWLKMRLDKDSLEKVKKETKDGLNSAGAAGTAAMGAQVRRGLPLAFAGSLKMIGGMMAGMGALLGGGALLKGIISVNREYQRFLVQLETFEGSSSGARAAFARMEQLAASTPFAIEQLVQAFITLRSAGLEPTDDMIRAFADNAAAMGGSVDDIAMAVRQAAVGETERLKAFGISARINGEQVTLAYDDIRMTVGRNAEEIAAAVQRISEIKFAGGAAREMATINGAMSNFQDNLGTISRALGDAGISEWVYDIANAMAKMTGDVATNREGWTYWVRITIAAIRAVVETVWFGMDALFNMGQAIGDGFLMLVGKLELAVINGINAATQHLKDFSNEWLGTEFTVADFRIDTSEAERQLRQQTFEYNRQVSEMEGAAGKIGEAWANVALAIEGVAAAEDRASAQRQTNTDQITASIADQIKAYGTEIEVLKAAHEAGLLQIDGYLRLTEIERQLGAIMRDTTNAMTDRIAAHEQLASIADIGPGGLLATGTDLGAINQDVRLRQRIENLEPIPVPVTPVVEWGSTADILADFYQFAHEGAEQAGRAMSDAFRGAFQILAEEGVNTGDLLNGIFRGIGQAMLGGLAEFAAGKASQNFMMAAEMLAYGLAGLAVPGISNPGGAFAAAAKFAAVGSAWAAFSGLAGAAGSIAGAGGRGMGGVDSGVNDNTADRAQYEDRDINIYIDPLDPYNPVVQDVVYVAGQSASERHGSGARVRVMPAQRRGR